VASSVAGQYQKVSEDVPEGTVNVWLRLLSPSGSLPDVTPRRAEALPPCALAVLVVGGATPAEAQGERPNSNPPLTSTDAVWDGATAFDGLEGGPEPLGFDAVTLNVYVVPLVRPVTVVPVGAGNPVTVVDGCATVPM
jgi:hypothetical protein